MFWATSRGGFMSYHRNPITFKGAQMSLESLQDLLIDKTLTSASKQVNLEAKRAA
jgi:hypothetical protein